MPKKNRTSLVLASVVAAVVMLGAVTACVTETSGQALPAPGAPVTKPKNPLETRATGTPRVPGWQVITITNTDKAYDVPPGWTTMGTDLVTFGPNKEISLVTPTIYKQGYCPANPASWRSMAGLVMMPNKTNIELGAAAAAQQIANVVFTTQDRVQPETEISDPKPVTVIKSTKAVVVTASLKIPVTGKDPCSAAKVSLAVMMIEPTNPDDGESATMIAMGDQDFAEATTEKDLKQIVTSFHVFA